LQGVRDQLACSKGSTLLILHNCDDIKKDYRQYIPNGAVVSIVMTTRLSDAKSMRPLSRKTPGTDFTSSLEVWTG